ncbi:MULTISPECIES: hypothetical protein [unclassified Meiothermus]|uniref:hypothetical protein n=1 Tax=unclassified Meiothermus TaxID=370471 RepID=UPI00157FAF82|nr:MULTISPECIES: hypothetical protein [unclassified Meiothermus]
MDVEALSQRPTVLEDTPEGFFERFAAYALEANLAPEPQGSPVLEVVTSAGVFLAFDRGLPPAPTGRARLLLHAEVEHLSYGGEASPGAYPMERGRYELRGRVVQALARNLYLMDIGVPVVLGLPSHLIGPDLFSGPLRVVTAPPLMAFRPDAQR